MVFARSHRCDVFHTLVMEIETREVRIGDTDAVVVRAVVVPTEISSNCSILLVLFRSNVFAKVEGGSKGDDDVWHYFEIPMMALGVLCVWVTYDKVIPESFSLASHKKLDCLCQSTFYIYLYQLPLLLIVGKLIMLVYPSSLTSALAYLFSPWITIVCLVLIALLLHKVFPRFYSVLVGGRVFRSS